MIALVFSDLHLSNLKSKYKVLSNGKSELLHLQEQFVRDSIDKHNPDIVLFLGDLTDYETLDPITLNATANVLNYVINNSKHSIWLEGNHCLGDASNHFTVLNAFNSFANLDNHHFVIKSELVEIGNIRFYCFAYFGDFESVQDNISEINQELDKNYKNILLFHYPTKNALLDNGLPASSGLELTEDVVGNFDLVLGGDYHKHQQLLNAHNAYYVGAPFMLVSNEDPRKGYLILDLDTLKFEHFENELDIKLFKGNIDKFNEVKNKYDTKQIFMQVDDLNNAQFEELKLMKDEFYNLSLRRKSLKEKVVKEKHLRNSNYETYIKELEEQEKERKNNILQKMLSEVG